MDAIKRFKTETGECLSYTLSRVMEVYHDSDGLHQRKRLNAVMSVCDRESAAHIFHQLAKGSGSNAPLVEFEDGIFRVGDFPNSLDNDECYPWPLVLAKLAFDVEKYHQDNLPTKKTDTSE